MCNYLSYTFKSDSSFETKISKISDEICRFSDHSYSRDVNKNLASLLSIYYGADIVGTYVSMFGKTDTKDGPVSIYQVTLKY